MVDAARASRARLDAVFFPVIIYDGDFQRKAMAGAAVALWTLWACRRADIRDISEFSPLTS